MNNLVDLFCKLAVIPSPSMSEDKVAEEILAFFKEHNISAKQDDFGNVYAKIPATDKAKKPIMLSAHMDVVGDFSPVNIIIDGNIIKTDGTRTLGADDKVGVAIAMMLAKEISENKTLAHGGLEITFTKDEEQSMQGIKAVDFKQFESEYVLVLDADRLGDFLISGASFVKMVLSVKSLKGGHSGVDIADTTRINAVKLISELIAQLPQGVYNQDETGVVTSINIGAVMGGGIKNIKTELQGSEFATFLVQNAMSNIINTDAIALYSIRSSSVQSQSDLINDIKQTVQKFNNDYQGKAEISVIFEEHMPAFEKTKDIGLIEIAKTAGQKVQQPVQISSFHAGAETHIYAHKQNALGQTFKPYLVGCANIYDMHSANECVEIDSISKGYEFIKSIFLCHNND